MTLAAAYGPVADIEILWTLIALCGFVFSAFNVKDATQDLQVLELQGIGNGRKIIAQSFRTAEITRLVKQAIFIAIGVIAMTIPGTPSQHLPLKILIFQFVFTWGMIAAALLTTLQSYMAYRVRTQIKDGAYAPDPIDLEGKDLKIEGQIHVKNGES